MAPPSEVALFGSQNGSIHQGGAVSDLFLDKTAPPSRWHQNNARGGAELRTMKRLQGPFWLHFFFSV